MAQYQPTNMAEVGERIGANMLRSFERGVEDRRRTQELGLAREQRAGELELAYERRRQEAGEAESRLRSRWEWQRGLLTAEEQVKIQKKEDAIRASTFLTPDQQETAIDELRTGVKRPPEKERVPPKVWERTMPDGTVVRFDFNPRTGEFDRVAGISEAAPARKPATRSEILALARIIGGEDDKKPFLECVAEAEEYYREPEENPLEEAASPEATPQQQSRGVMKWLWRKSGDLVINGRAATGKAIFNAVCALSEDEQEAEGLPEELPPEQRKFDESQAGKEYPMSLSPMQTARPEGAGGAVSEEPPAAVETAPAGQEGKIHVRRLSDGAIGWLNPEDFDPAKYEKL